MSPGEGVDTFVTAFAVSFGVVFVAELGDKSQIAVLTLATRFRAFPVLLGLTFSAAVTHLVSVAVGFGVGASLPDGWISLAAAAMFVGFGLWGLRARPGEEHHVASNRRFRSGSVVASVAVTFFLAELGDKTMLATMALAAQYDWVAVWLGSTAGMVAVAGIAIVVGRALGRRLPERVVAVASSALFLVFGSAMLVRAVPLVGGVDGWAGVFASLGPTGLVGAAVVVLLGTGAVAARLGARGDCGAAPRRRRRPV